MHDELAVAAGVAVGDLDAPARARTHRPPAGRDQVEAGVERGAARAEAVADRIADRAQEAQRRARRRAAQRGERPRAGHAVGREARPRLEAAQRGVGVGAEAAVDAAGREAVGGEQELQRRHVPAAGPQRQRPAAEPRPPAAAERAPRARPGDAVGRQPAAALQPPDGGGRRRPGDAVHAAGVEAAGAQRDLEGGDVGGGGSRRTGRCDEHAAQRQEEQARADRPTNG